MNNDEGSPIRLALAGVARGPDKGRNPYARTPCSAGLPNSEHTPFAYNMPY